MSELVRVACNGQLLLDREWTGTNRAAFELIAHLQARADTEVTLQAFAPSRARRDALRALFPFLKQTQFAVRAPLRTAPVQWLWALLPFTRRFFFKTEDVYLAFGQHIPCGIREKRTFFIYDMVLARYPETMEAANRRKLRRTLRRSCRRADRIFTISEASRRDIVRYLGVPEEKLTVVPMAADRSLFRADCPQEEIDACLAHFGLSQGYFLYLGTLEPRKNLLRLIEAYAALRARCMPPVLVIAGKKGWQYEALFAAVEQKGLTHSVIFTGYVEDADVPLLMCGARAFVFPSYYEGFGMPPLEAMACGTPVMVSDAEALTEVVGDAGLTVPREDTAAMTEAMHALAFDDAL
ncbi:MAG: glycosyltransferase family 1 protein, partial [Clostridia bacterium]|nr:glycosyltransferase family 1 protein [Clostridia bacterium]